MEQMEFNFMKDLRARIDISGAKDVDEVELGDIVWVKLKGKVTAMRGPDKSLITSFDLDSGKKGKEREHTMPGSLELAVQSMEVSSSEDFSGMAEDE